MNKDSYMKLPGFSRPLGYYLRRVTDGVRIAYVFTSRKQLLEICPGQMEKMNEEYMVRDEIGPLCPDYVPLKETFG